LVGKRVQLVTKTEPNDQQKQQQHCHDSAPPLVQSQLAEVFKTLVYCDYPERWPGLLQEVFGHLTSQVT
jgi:hypothetical protein